MCTTLHIVSGSKVQRRRARVPSTEQMVPRQHHYFLLGCELAYLRGHSMLSIIFTNHQHYNILLTYVFEEFNKCLAATIYVNHKTVAHEVHFFLRNSRTYFLSIKFTVKNTQLSNVFCFLLVSTRLGGAIQFVLPIRVYWKHGSSRKQRLLQGIRRASGFGANNRGIEHHTIVHAVRGHELFCPG